MGVERRAIAGVQGLALCASNRLNAVGQTWRANVGGRQYPTLADLLNSCQEYLGT